MKIAKVETIPLQIPYQHDGPPAGWGGARLAHIEYFVNSGGDG